MKSEREMREELKKYCLSRPVWHKECKLYEFFDGHGSCHSRCDYNTLKEHYEIVFGKEKEDMEMFKKEDIEPGYLLEIEKNGIRYLAIVTYGTNGCLCYSSECVWGPISYLSDKLYNGKSRIMKVYGYASNCSAYKIDACCRPLLWDRESPKEMTIKEIEEVLGYPVKIMNEKE